MEDDDDTTLKLLQAAELLEEKKLFDDYLYDPFDDYGSFAEYDF